MQQFRGYLKQKQLSKTSVDRYVKLAKFYRQWLKENGLTAAAVRYKDLLRFIKYLNALQLSKKYMNLHLTAIRHFYNYRIVNGQQKYNPAAATFIKGITRRLPHDLLEAEELHRLYDSYQGEAARKVILGLVVFQALKQEALARIAIKHCHLEIGKIYIIGTSRYDSRTLDLQAKQILELSQFIAARDGKLFNPEVNNTNVWLQNQLKWLVVALKKINPQVKNASQLRASVIAGWLKTTGVRKVQYLAGHKYVSSTERYEQSSLEKLKEQLQIHHPLK